MKKHILYAMTFLAYLSQISSLSAAEEELPKVLTREGVRTELHEGTLYRMYNLTDRRLATSAIKTNWGNSVQWVMPENQHHFDENKDWDDCATFFFRKSPKPVEEGAGEGYRIYNMWGSRLATTAQTSNHGAFAQWVVRENLHRFDENKDWDACATFYLTKEQGGYQIYNLWNRRLAMSEEATHQGFKAQWVSPDYKDLFEQREEWNKAATFTFIPTCYRLKMTADKHYQELLIVNRQSEILSTRDLKVFDNLHSDLPAFSGETTDTLSERHVDRYDVGQSSTLRLMKTFTSSHRQAYATSKRTAHEVEVNAGWSGFGFSASTSYRGSTETSHSHEYERAQAQQREQEATSVNHSDRGTEIERTRTETRTIPSTTVPPRAKWIVKALKTQTTEHNIIQSRVRLQVDLQKVINGNCHQTTRMALQGEDLRNFLSLMYPDNIDSSNMAIDAADPLQALVKVQIPYTVTTVAEQFSYETQSADQG